MLLFKTTWWNFTELEVFSVIQNGGTIVRKKDGVEDRKFYRYVETNKLETQIQNVFNVIFNVYIGSEDKWDVFWMYIQFIQCQNSRR